MNTINVLIVEDDKMLSTVSGMFVQSMGHTLVAKLQSGADAIDFCKNNTVDIILMDIHLMDNMDGIETLNELNKFTNIPVIFLTSDSNTATVSRTKIKNSYGFLQKPVDKNLLDRTIREAIDKFSSKKN